VYKVIKIDNKAVFENIEKGGHRCHVYVF